MALLKGVRLEGLNRRTDEVKEQTYDQLYEDLRKEHLITVHSKGWERHEVEDLGECLSVVLPYGPAKGLLPAAEAGDMPWRFLSDLVGQDLIVMVQQIDREKGLVIVSRKAAQERQALRTWEALLPFFARLNLAKEAAMAARRDVRAARAAGSKEEYIQAIDLARQTEKEWRTMGPVLLAVARKVTEKAVYMDIGGVMAVMGRQEISSAPVDDCRAVVKAGDGFEVRVMTADQDRNIVWVSRRALLPDPWETVTRNYQEGGMYEAKVVREREQDVIVELEPGLAVRVDRYVLGPGPGAKVLVLLRRMRPEARWMGGRILRVIAEAPEGDEGAQEARA